MSQQSDIRIDPSVLTNRTEAFSSLTDVNGTAVFTNHYEEQIEQYQQKEEASRSGSICPIHGRRYQSGDTD